MYTSVVYDLDGTLIDSARTVAGLLNARRTERGLAPRTVADFTPWLSIGGRALVSAALELDEAEGDAELSLFRERYALLATDPDIMFEGVEATLSQLHALGIPLALCTNKPRSLTDKILAETGLFRFFSFVSAGHDLPTQKPHPDNLHICLDALGCTASETLLIGDSRIDQILADQCGAGFAFFSGGYDDGVLLTDDTPVIQRHIDVLDLIGHLKGRAHHE